MATLTALSEATLGMTLREFIDAFKVLPQDKCRSWALEWSGHVKSDPTVMFQAYATDAGLSADLSCPQDALDWFEDAGAIAKLRARGYVVTKASCPAAKAADAIAEGT